MGASGWSYFIRYERDASRALQSLQQRVFKLGEYGPPKLAHAIASQVVQDTDPKTLERDSKLYVLAKWVEAASRGEINPETAVPNLQDVQVTPALIAEWQRERTKHLRSWLGGKKPKHTSIDALKADCKEAGTHSIIDIVGISTTPRPFHASPLPVDDIVRIFGTAKPARVYVQSTSLPLDSIVTPQQAWYLPIWNGQKKTHYYFEGASGD